jgi:hypothetical protein
MSAELLVSVLTSMVLVCLAYQLNKITKSMAESALHRPYVFLFMKSEGSTVGLRNNGDRVAHDVRVRILQDHTESGTSFFGQSLLFRHPISSIPPGGETKDSFMYGVILPASVATMAVEIIYRGQGGKTYRETVHLRAADYADWFHNRPLEGRPSGDVHTQL